MYGNFWGDVRKLPNIITLIRLFFGAHVTIILYKNGFKYAWIVFLLFVATDWLDGLVARQQKSVTRLGMRLDPLADQFLVLPILWMFYWVGGINYIPPLLLTAREFLMLVLRIYAGRPIQANNWGKAKVVAEYIGISLLLAGGAWYVPGLLMFLPIILLAGISFMIYAYDVFRPGPRKDFVC